MNITNVLEGYNRNLDNNENINTKTAYSYYYDVKGFLAFVNIRSGLDSDDTDISKYLKEIRIPDLLSYLNKLKYTDKKSDSTINRKLTSLDSLFKYLWKENIIDKGDLVENIQRYKIGKADPEWISFNLIEELFKS